MPNRYGSIMAPGYVAPTPWRDGLLRGLLDASPIGVLDMLQSVPLTPADAVWRAITPQRPALGDAIAGRLGFGAPPADLGDYGSEYDSGRLTGNMGLLGAGGVLGAASRAGRGLLGAVRQGQSMNSGGLLGGGTGKIEGALASKSPSIYDPKPLPQRPFQDDYPSWTAGGDGGGRVAFDIDGRPTTPSAIIAGRRTAGGVDEGIRGGEADWLVGALAIRRGGAPRSSPDLRGDFGRYTHHDRRLTVDQALPPEQADRVFSHELAHAIEKHTFGQAIPTDGLKKELAQIYSDLNSSAYVPKSKIGATPATFGYKGADVDRELIAEALRAYMTDPNYIKSVAPKTAARLREYVNTNPNLNRHIMLNSMLGAPAGAGLLGGEGSMEEFRRGLLGPVAVDRLGRALYESEPESVRGARRPLINLETP